MVFMRQRGQDLTTNLAEQRCVAPGRIRHNVVQ